MRKKILYGLLGCFVVVIALSGYYSYTPKEEALSTQLSSEYMQAMAEFKPAQPTGDGVDLAAEARSAVLMDAGTGKVLFQKNEHEKLPPASVTKVMTMLLLMEAVDSGQIRLDDKVKVSEYAASMGGSQIFLQPGEQISVNDLLKGIAIVSANDASVVVAELLGGTEKRFVEMMNAKAKKMGLKNTFFKNPNGLPIEGHYSSALDIAIMARELLKHQKITKYTGIYEDYLRKDSPNPFWLVNTNKLVRFYEGVDGLKTGFTAEAKYCLVATAKRGEMRVISVVMGEPDSKIRNQEISQMLDHSFNSYNSYPIYKENELIAEANIPNSEVEKVRVRASQPFSVLLKKNANPSKIEKRIVWNKLEAPIRCGETIGKVEVVQDGRLLAQMNLEANVDLPKATFWTTTKRVLKGLMLAS